MSKPILQTKIFEKKGLTYELTVAGGLHKLGGNQYPYFSLTGEIWHVSKRTKKRIGRDCESCGMLHNEILKHFPEFADLAALHLSDNEGAPMHALENGWYWMGKTQYQARNNEILANHLRISLEEASSLNFETKADFSAYIAKQMPRWKEEAEACIKKHNLQVFNCYA